jgi:hypothetical protein
MRRLAVLRSLAAFLIALILFAAPASAQEDIPSAEWQAVITHQIQAFRDKDADAAFGDAAPYFHALFPHSGAFFEAIITSGYGPIMDSSNHSFGPFESAPDAKAAIQLVKLTGTDGKLYEAIYNMTKEEAGWRVSGVVLRDLGGIGI